MGRIDRVPPVADPERMPSTRGRVLNHAAGLYDLLSPAMMFWQEQPINRRAAGLLELQPGDLVLDVGCATGGLTESIARYLDAASGGMAVGLDAAPRMVEVARSKHASGRCRFDIGVAEDLPYGDDCFDKAASSFFFHHVNLADKERSLCEIHRVLRPGGALVVADIDVPSGWFGGLCARSGEWLFRQPEIGENIDGKLAPLFLRSGFVELETVYSDLGYVSTWLMRKSLALQPVPG